MKHIELLLAHCEREAHPRPAKSSPFPDVSKNHRFLTPVLAEDLCKALL